MEKSNIDIKMDCFYEFLCSSPLADMATIRKMYTYYQSFVAKYRYTIYQYDRGYSYEKSNGWNARRFLEMEHNKLHKTIRLMHDSYLAILLQRLDFDQYINIIKGLYGYFECNETKVNPPLKDKHYKNEEYTLTKDQYIEYLLILQHSSSNAGDYLFTSSLGSIIEIEKEIIKSEEKVKGLSLKQQIPYGDLQIHKYKNYK